MCFAEWDSNDLRKENISCRRSAARDIVVCILRFRHDSDRVLVAVVLKSSCRSSSVPFDSPCVYARPCSPPPLDTLTSACGLANRRLWYLCIAPKASRGRDGMDVVRTGSNARRVDRAKNGRGKPQIRPDAEVSNSRQEQCAN
jgi:hypothetical protein